MLLLLLLLAGSAAQAQASSAAQLAVATILNVTEDGTREPSQCWYQLVVTYWSHEPWYLLTSRLSVALLLLPVLLGC